MASLPERRRHTRASAGFMTAPASLASHGSAFMQTRRRHTAARNAAHCAPARRRARWQTSALTSGEDEDPDVVEVEDVAHVADTDAHERQRRIQALDNAGSAQIPVPGNATVVEVEFAPGRTMRFETGRVSRQAGGAVIARTGDTLVHCTCCAEKRTKADSDFFPLRVDYAEKFSSAGRTPGSYIKREGRPSE
eukprot:IDg14283t1